MPDSTHSSRLCARNICYPNSLDLPTPLGWGTQCIRQYMQTIIEEDQEPHLHTGAWQAGRQG